MDRYGLLLIVINYTDLCLNMRHLAFINFNDPSKGSEAYLVPDRIPGKFLLMIWEHL